MKKFRVSLRIAAFVALLGAVLFATSAEAQRVSGTIRDSASAGTVSGAVVVILDAENRTLTRGLTNTAGQYSLDLSATARKLRVVRIGFRPRVIDIAGLGTPSPVDVRMQRLTTLLSAVEVNDDRVCSKDAGRLEALSLWEQARAGLLAAIVAREANPATAELISYERQIEVADDRVIWQKAHRITGRTVKPFVAASAPSVFAEQGYARTVDKSTEFFAPDEDVLLDESFARTHCFTVRRADKEHEGALGLAFEPARGRDKLIDVKGVLWMEAGTPGLRSIEYRYMGPDEVLTSTEGRGIIHFVSMPNGVTFIDEWLSHLPVLTERPVSGGMNVTVTRGPKINTARRAEQFGETGGIVVYAEWPDGSKWKSPMEPLSGTITEEKTHRPVGDVMVAVQATGDTVLTDSLGRFAIYPLFPGKYEVTVADTLMEAFVEPRVQKYFARVVHEGVNVMTAEVPSRRLAIRRLCEDTAIADRHAILLGRVANTDAVGSLPKGLRVKTSWLADTRVVMTKNVFAANFDTQGLEVDDAGRFSACGAPTEKAIRLTLSRGRMALLDTVITIDRSTEIERFMWPVSASALSQAQELKAPIISGRVVSSKDASPIVGVEIWLPALDRRVRTDSNGRFRIDSLSPALTLIQLRKVGFAVLRDVLAPTEEGTPAHTFALTPQGTELDTVRTVAAGRAISPALRAFEERRLRGESGYFIPDSVLRAQDDKSLSSIIMQRVSGLTLMPGRMGAMLMLNSRKPCQGTFGGCQVPNCYVSVYLDGLRIYSATIPGATPPDASQIKVNELAGVEYYPTSAAAPVQYNGTDSGCGVLLLWTRER